MDGFREKPSGMIEKHSNTFTDKPPALSRSTFHDDLIGH